jgi:hypothetical protein
MVECDIGITLIVRIGVKIRDRVRVRGSEWGEG